MKNKTLIVALIAGLAACSTDGKLKIKERNDCGDDSTGVTNATVHYGDSRLKVTPVSEIRVGSEFRLVLTPRTANGDPADYTQSRVTVFAEDGNPEWFRASGTAAENRFLSICVQGDVRVGDVIKFLVEVEDVGTLDPRARVIN